VVSVDDSRAVTRVGGSIDAFLSYNSEDFETVFPIFQQLEAYGFDLFFDRDNLSGGDHLRTVIEDGIRRARCFIAFIGSEGEGDWQTDEIDMARKREKGEGSRFRLIVVLLNGANEAKLGLLSGKLYIDASQADVPVDTVKLAKLINSEREAYHDCPSLDLSTVKTKPSAVVDRRQSRSVSIGPKLLPKLFDRDEPCEHLNRVAPKIKGKPGVFVLPSEPDQRPGSFGVRVRRYELPRCLNLQGEAEIIEQLSLVFPDSYQGEVDFHESLRYRLSERLYQKGRVAAGLDATQKILSQEIASLAPVVIILCRISASNWVNEGLEKIKAFLSFWESFPEIPGDGSLFILTSVELPNSEGSEKTVKVRKEMEAFLTDLRQESVKEEGMHVLPRIKGATQADFSHWALRSEVTHHFHEIEDELEDMAQEIFKSLSNEDVFQPVPLEKAEIRLKKLTDQYVRE